MADTARLAASVDVSNVHFLWFFKKGKGCESDFVPAETIADGLIASYEQAKKLNVLIDNVEILKSQLFSLAGTKYDLSNAGWQSLAVGPDGLVYPTPAMVGEAAMAAGHISEGIGKVWRESPVLQIVRNASIADDSNYGRNPLKFLVGGGDIDHSFIYSRNLTGADPYSEVYNRMALKLLAEEAAKYEDRGGISILCRMGERLHSCGDDMGQVAFTHSNCVLSLPGKEGHTLVKAFYSAAAKEPNEEIFNPVSYDESEISHVPAESRMRSYGCGSPVLDAGLEAGQAVVDFGSGTGVECFIAAKKVGPEGSVIGIDMAEAMLAVARKSKPEVVGNLGYDNIDFRKAFFEQAPIESGSVDVVISNCVINLSPDKRKVFSEIFRILKPGGRAVISDISYDEEIPLSIKYNEKLRGECIGGAFREDELFGLLGDLGFEAARVLKRFPYRQINGHSFYSITYSTTRPGRAEKKEVMYRGPFATIVTDDGAVLRRGTKTEVNLSSGFATDDSVFLIDETGNVTNVEQQVTCACFTRPEQTSVPAVDRPKHTSGCMVCGAELEYLDIEQKLTCYYCGNDFLGNAVCKARHYVCDKCHAQDALSIIKNVCLLSDDTDMLKLMQKIRSHRFFPMHGPEHHAMVPAVILTVYRSVTGRLRDEQMLSGVERGTTISGGSCAFMGICGAAVGVGIAFSVILEANPYKGRQRQDVQQLTAQVLRAIGEYEAARCCQRDCWIGLREAARLSKAYLGVSLPAEAAFTCAQFERNAECIGNRCQLHPRASVSEGMPATKSADEPVSAIGSRCTMSVIIPVLGEYELINTRIEEVGCQEFYGEFEIIVVDGDPLGSTIKAVEDPRVICMTGPKGRGTQMNAGASVARGEILLFLHADTRLPPDALKKAAAVLEDERFVGGAFDLGIDSDRLILRYIAARARFRSHLNRIPYGDQAIFIKRDYFESIGGYKETPLMEDIDLMRRIKKDGRKIRILRERVATSPRRWETEGAIYTTLRNQALVSLYYLGVSPRTLARFYKICTDGRVRTKHRRLSSSKTKKD
jgi:rSAM/selenodomain-associated transferase 2